MIFGKLSEETQEKMVEWSLGILEAIAILGPFIIVIIAIVLLITR